MKNLLVVILAVAAVAASAQAQTVDFWLSHQGSQSPITDVNLFHGQTVDLSLWYQTDDSFAHNTLEVLVAYDSASTKGASAVPLDGHVEIAGGFVVNTAIFDQALISDAGGGYSGSGGIRPYGAHLVVAKLTGTVTANTPTRIADLTLRNVSVPDGYSSVVTVHDAGSGDNWTSAIANGATMRRDPELGWFLIHSTSVAPVSIADAKILADGVYVSCTGKGVTAVFGGDFYIEEPDRSSGVRVTKQAHGALVGNTASVTGLLSTDPVTGERFINAANGTVLTSPGTELKALAMSNRSLGGTDFGVPPDGQRGVSGGIGPNNVGLLVRAAGRVTRIDSASFTLDDGSGAVVRVICPAGSAPATDEFAAVTGISSCDAPGGNRLLKARIASDVRTYGP